MKRILTFLSHFVFAFEQRVHAIYLVPVANPVICAIMFREQDTIKDTRISFFLHTMTINAWDIVSFVRYSFPGYESLGM
jgi:hypothetical protein